MNKYQLLMTAKKLASKSKKITTIYDNVVRQIEASKKTQKTVARQDFLNKKEAGLKTCGKHKRFMHYKNSENTDMMF